MAQSTLLMSCRASQLTYSHFSRAGLDLPGSEAVLSTTAPAFPPVISRFFKMKLMKQVLFFSTHYALVICNHALTPTHRAGPDIAGKIRPSFDFALSPQCRVKAVFFVWFLLHKNSRDYSHAWKLQQCRQTAKILPTVCPRSTGLLAGICWRISGWTGPWLQMTGALVGRMAQDEKGNQYKLAAS